MTLNAFSQEKNLQEKKWLVEPIKLSSLMVNTHPEYNGWGLEVGRKLSEKVWATSMIEKTKGGDFMKYFDPDYDYLVTFSYFAWLNTVRYYFKPEATYTMFVDGGMELQKASHKFLRDGDLMKEKALALGPIVMIGGEWRFHEHLYFKWRFGGFVNVVKNGSMTERIDDGQDQPSYQLYPHLSDAVLSNGTYAGDVALGIRF